MCCFHLKLNSQIIKFIYLFYILPLVAFEASSTDEPDKFQIWNQFAQRAQQRVHIKCIRKSKTDQRNLLLGGQEEVTNMLHRNIL